MPHDDVMQKNRRQIVSQKFMLAVVWGIDGLHIVDLMTEQHNYNTQYFRRYIMEPMLSSISPDGRKPHHRQPNTHWTSIAFTAQNPLMGFSLKMKLFEGNICHIVQT
jgi:hypothetical protein